MRELARYCEARGSAFERCGKLIVALDAASCRRWTSCERRGEANGVTGLRRVDAAGLREIEPHAAGIAALHSPETAIVDFAAVAARSPTTSRGGGEIVTGAAVERVDGARRARRRPARTRAARDRRAARGRPAPDAWDGAGSRFAVFCAGAWSDRLAALAGAGPDPRIVPFRGAYLRLLPHRRGARARADLSRARPAPAVPGRPSHAPASAATC